MIEEALESRQMKLVDTKVAVVKHKDEKIVYAYAAATFWT